MGYYGRPNSRRDMRFQPSLEEEKRMTPTLLAWKLMVRREMRA